MTQIIQGTVLQNLNIRSGAGTEHMDIGDLRVGDSIEASENIYQWLHLTKVNGAPVEGWASAGSMQQYIKWVYVVVEEPPPPADVVPPDYIVAHWIATNKTTKYVPE